MTTDMTQPNTAVEIYTRSIDTFRGGEHILIATQGTVSKALAAGQGILQRIQDNGGVLTPDLDKLCNDYIAKCNQRKNEAEESRKPVTQIMDAVRKLFTEEEKKIDVKLAGSIPAQLQQYRNSYARLLAEEENRRRQAAEQQAAKEREKAGLMAECERQLSAYFNNYLFAAKQELQEFFNRINPDTYDGARASIMGLDPIYSYSHFTAYRAQLNARYHTQEEISAIIATVAPSRFDPCCNEYRSQMLELKQSLMDRLPSKKIELEQIAAAGEEEARRLAQQKADRERGEAARLNREAEETRRREELAIAQRQTEGETMALFNQDINIGATTPQPETRQGYEIEVSHQAGWVQLFQLWYEQEGKNLPLDKIGSKKLDSVKAFCEKYAHKTGTKIESQFLKYTESYKAVNRKDA